MAKKKDGKQDGKIEELETKIKELEENWKRAVADYQNLRKRLEKEKEEFVKYANQRLLKSLLSVWDGLDKASSQLKADAGIELILKQLGEILESEGIEKVEVRKGDKFDPATMEAIETVKRGKKDTVVEVLREGFRYKERLLRPTEVKVNV